MFISNGKKPLHIARKHISHSASATRPTNPSAYHNDPDRTRERNHRNHDSSVLPPQTPCGSHTRRIRRTAGLRHARLDRCRFGNRKTSCKHCPIHCYAREKRILMKEVMRWCGPRMLFYHPIIALRHLLRR